MDDKEASYDKPEASSGDVFSNNGSRFDLQQFEIKVKRRNERLLLGNNDKAKKLEEICS